MKLFIVLLAVVPLTMVHAQDLTNTNIYQAAKAADDKCDSLKTQLPPSILNIGCGNDHMLAIVEYFYGDQKSSGQDVTCKKTVASGDGIDIYLNLKSLQSSDKCRRTLQAGCPENQGVKTPAELDQVINLVTCLTGDLPGTLVSVGKTVKSVGKDADTIVPALLIFLYILLKKVLEALCSANTDTVYRIIGGLPWVLVGLSSGLSGILGKSTAETVGALLINVYVVVLLLVAVLVPLLKPGGAVAGLLKIVSKVLDAVNGLLNGVLGVLAGVLGPILSALGINLKDLQKFLVGLQKILEKSANDPVKAIVLVVVAVLAVVSELLVGYTPTCVEDLTNPLEGLTGGLTTTLTNLLSGVVNPSTVNAVDGPLKTLTDLLGGLLDGGPLEDLFEPGGLLG